MEKDEQTASGRAISWRRDVTARLFSPICRLLQAGLVALLLLTSEHALAEAPLPDRFAVILWHSDGSAPPGTSFPALGITAGRIFGQRDRFDVKTLRAQADRLRIAGLAVMVENIATDFYSSYHRWRPSRPVNAAMEALRARYAADPTDPALWRRVPSLSDEQALRGIERRLTAHAAALRGRDVIYESLGDETGIADLSAAWDFDETPAALIRWRSWLAQRYGSLRALNGAWKTHYSTWRRVMPTRTDNALADPASRPGWMEMKAWMDLAFAKAVGRGAAAVHRGDPGARAAIEGAQLPGWGGYDYPLLARGVDTIELPGGYTAAIARGFHPSLFMLTTSSSATAEEANRLWRFLLLGGRGVVLWDPDGALVRDPALPGLLAGLHGSEAETLLRARPVHDPVGVLYSQASFRLRWLLDRAEARRHGGDWTRRDDDTELADSPWRGALQAVAESLPHLALNPVWLDADGLTDGRLAGLQTVLLPQAIALDDRAVAVLRRFAAGGGRIVADAEPGLYDTLGRVRAVPPLLGMGQRLPRFDTSALRGVLTPFASLVGADGSPAGDVSLFRFNNDRLIAIQADRASAPGKVWLNLPGRSIRLSLGDERPVVLVRRSSGWRCIDTHRPE